MLGCKCNNLKVHVNVYNFTLYSIAFIPTWQENLSSKARTSMEQTVCTESHVQ